MNVVPMTEEFAADIATWRYPEPYGRYTLDGADPGFFTDPANGYVALVEGDTLIGYRTFGREGQVPGGPYDDSALDTGGGLRPGLTGLGQGLGRRAIATGLAYGHQRYRPDAFRVTIAGFNARARRVVESLGFVHVVTFNAATDGSGYDIFRRAQ